MSSNSSTFSATFTPYLREAEGAKSHLQECLDNSGLSEERKMEIRCQHLEFKVEELEDEKKDLEDEKDEEIEKLKEENLELRLAVKRNQDEIDRLERNGF